MDEKLLDLVDHVCQEWDDFSELSYLKEVAEVFHACRTLNYFARVKLEELKNDGWTYEEYEVLNDYSDREMKKAIIAVTEKRIENFLNKTWPEMEKIHQALVNYKVRKTRTTGELSEEEKKRRQPLPPWVLMNGINEPAHIDLEDDDDQ
jgi:hypothetical protein